MSSDATWFKVGFGGAITIGLATSDPCDDCVGWIGNLPAVDSCLACGGHFNVTGHDKHDTARCPDCATERRDALFLSDCCNADLTTRTVAHCDRHGDIESDHYYCGSCEEVKE